MRALTAASIVLLLGISAPAPADDKPIETPYYPLKVGNAWTYKAGDSTITVTVAKFEEVNKQNCARLESTGSNKAQVVEDVAVKADGVYRIRAADKEVKPEVKFLALPPKKGETWDVNAIVGTEKLKGTFKSDEVDEVKVPAGTYKNVVTVTGNDFDANGQKISMTYFFAKDVGLVKQIIKIGGAEVVLELEKFEPGK